MPGSVGERPSGGVDARLQLDALLVSLLDDAAQLGRGQLDERLIDGLCEGQRAPQRSEASPRAYNRVQAVAGRVGRATRSYHTHDR